MWRLGFFFSFNIGRAWVRSVVGRQLSLCFRKLIRTASEVRFWWHRWEIPVSVGWKIELARWWPRSWLKVTPWYLDRTEDGGKSENWKNEIIWDVKNKMRKFKRQKTSPSSTRAKYAYLTCAHLYSKYPFRRTNLIWVFFNKYVLLFYLPFGPDTMVSLLTEIVGWKIELARWWPQSWLKVTPWYPDRTEDRGKSENWNNEIILDIDKKWECSHAENLTR